MIPPFSGSGCPIRKSSDLRYLGSSPRLIAAVYVLHRLFAPRHPPFTLSSLTQNLPLRQLRKTCGFALVHSGLSKNLAVSADTAAVLCGQTPSLPQGGQRVKSADGQAESLDNRASGTQRLGRGIQRIRSCDLLERR